MLGGLNSAIRAVFSWIKTVVEGLGGVFFHDGRPSLLGIILLITLTIGFIDLIFSLFGGGSNE